MKNAIVKIRKGLILHFVSRNEDEEIIKSSNNRSTGMIKTYSPKLNRDKEYSVNLILSWISDGFIVIK